MFVIYFNVFLQCCYRTAPVEGTYSVDTGHGVKDITVPPGISVHGVDDNTDPTDPEIDISDIPPTSNEYNVLEDTATINSVDIIVFTEVVQTTPLDIVSSLVVTDGYNMADSEPTNDMDIINTDIFTRHMSEVLYETTDDNATYVTQPQMDKTNTGMFSDKRTTSEDGVFETHTADNLLQTLYEHTRTNRQIISPTTLTVPIKTPTKRRRHRRTSLTTPMMTTPLPRLS